MYWNYSTIHSQNNTEDDQMPVQVFNEDWKNPSNTSTKVVEEEFQAGKCATKATLESNDVDQRPLSQKKTRGRPLGSKKGPTKTNCADEATSTNSEPKKKRKRKKKDPNKPKRGVSAYNFFFKETRTKILASLSSELTEPINTERDDGPPMISTDDEKWSKNSQEYMFSQHKPDMPIRTVGSTQVSASDFIQESITTESTETAEVNQSRGGYSDDSPEKTTKRRKPVIIEGKISFDNLAKEIGRRWKELSVEKRAPYIELAKKDAVRFDSEMATYNEAMLNKVEINFLRCVPDVCKEEHELSHCVNASIMESTTMGQQFRVPLGTKEAEVIFCRARKVADDHTNSTAFLTPVGNMFHGADLICSHPLCRLQGVKFKYCAFCKKVSAKHHFKNLHSHYNKDSNKSVLMDMNSTEAVSNSDKLISLTTSNNHHFNEVQVEKGAAVEHRNDGDKDNQDTKAIDDKPASYVSGSVDGSGN
mmetsp:Transcript_29760/g.43668  ORF Transcript_29760/g.43668 Transcript_29760/m.43668 type:complete len:476 (+) Transcript_29760:2182-3609(+)